MSLFNKKKKSKEEVLKEKEARRKERREDVVFLKETAGDAFMLLNSKKGSRTDLDKVNRVIYYFSLFVFVLSLLGISGHFFRIYTVSGSSMYPTLKDKQYVSIRITQDISYGDIVICEPEDEQFQGKHIVKRVLALPGDVIKASGGTVYRNGQPLSEEYASETEDFGPVFIEEGHVFLVGDNRNNSLDSRGCGAFSIDEIIGVKMGD